MYIYRAFRLAELVAKNNKNIVVAEKMVAQVAEGLGVALEQLCGGHEKRDWARVGAVPLFFVGVGGRFGLALDAKLARRGR